MAKVYPERPPQSILDDPLRSAELRVFLALQQLPDKYRVFYSMHWQRHQEDVGVREGEADFVIAHPDFGVIVLEVKGGGITFDAERGQWFSQSRDGEQHAIQDPLEQGRRSHYEIRRKLEALPGWPPQRLNTWHAACFPDVNLRPGQFLRPDLPREMVIDADDLKDSLATIKRVFLYCFGANYAEGAPGPERMQMIEGLLASSFEISTPLGIELEQEERKLVQLTEQQFWALSILGDRKRAAIAGCAGSGKTMLAVRKAQQFSALGMNVLLVCFNIALSVDLRRRLPASIDVYNFHELCRATAKRAGYTPRCTQDENELYSTILPEALLEAAETTGRLYDAVIVDEGQDFQENYWIALESLLKEDGHLYIFFDDNQNLYGGSEDFSGLITEPPFRLNQNCRNTQAIHTVVAKFHNKPESLFCFGPEGREPVNISYNGSDDLIRKLQRLIHRLVYEEGIATHELVILTPRGESRTRLVPGLKLGNFTLVNQAPNHPAEIQATSVYKFKGLERKVVILGEIDERWNYNRDMVMYVGCSRARTHLIFLIEENTPLQIKERIQAET